MTTQRKTPAQRRDEADVAASDRLLSAMQELLGAKQQCEDLGLDVHVTLDRWSGAVGRTTSVCTRRSFKTGKSNLVRLGEWVGVTRKQLGEKL